LSEAARIRHACWWRGGLAARGARTAARQAAENRLPGHGLGFELEALDRRIRAAAAPGRARLATMPVPIGSLATVNTMGMVDVTCFAAGMASPDVTMTSTLSPTSSAAISAKCAWPYCAERAARPRRRGDRVRSHHLGGEVCHEN